MLYKMAARKKYHLFNKGRGLEDYKTSSDEVQPSSCSPKNSVELDLTSLRTDTELGSPSPRSSEELESPPPTTKVELCSPSLRAERDVNSSSVKLKLELGSPLSPRMENELDLSSLRTKNKLDSFSLRTEVELGSPLSPRTEVELGSPLSPRTEVELGSPLSPRTEVELDSSSPRTEPGMSSTNSCSSLDDHFSQPPLYGSPCPRDSLKSSSTSPSYTCPQYSRRQKVQRTSAYSSSPCVSNRKGHPQDFIDSGRGMLGHYTSSDPTLENANLRMNSHYFPEYYQTFVPGSGPPHLFPYSPFLPTESPFIRSYANEMNENLNRLHYERSLCLEKNRSGRQVCDSLNFIPFTNHFDRNPFPRQPMSTSIIKPTPIKQCHVTGSNNVLTSFMENISCGNSYATEKRMQEQNLTCSHTVNTSTDDNSKDVNCLKPNEKSIQQIDAEGEANQVSNYSNHSNEKRSSSPEIIVDVIEPPANKNNSIDHNYLNLTNENINNETFKSIEKNDYENMEKIKRNQSCRLCKNHLDKKIDVKGHKYFCPYLNCKCKKCLGVQNARHFSKLQQKISRQHNVEPPSPILCLDYEKRSQKEVSNSSFQSNANQFPTNLHEEMVKDTHNLLDLELFDNINKFVRPKCRV